MKNKVRTQRNWAIVVIASLLIVIGNVAFLLAVTNIGVLGWWSLLMGFSGLTTIAAAIMSIVKNDASWILLDLLLPG